MRKKAMAMVFMLGILWGCMPMVFADRMEQSTKDNEAFLSVQNGRLYRTDGTEVVLHGINLGGWMLMETWMSPLLDEAEELAHTDVQQILTKRFGKGREVALFKLYRENFITEADFTRIAALGFNCVRIPFWYGNFMTEDGSWLSETHDQNPGFQTLDWALWQCEENGLYAILDLHGCPGGQSANHSTGSIRAPQLFQNETYLASMEKLWTALAERYRNKACVAAYDIMNEPQNNGNFPEVSQAESPEAVAQTNRVYDRMVQAIREVDSRHVITLEGIWSIHTLPDPREYGWQNMMYQLHIYDREQEAIDKRLTELMYARTTWGVAVYVGEYNSGALERYAADWYETNGINRSKWTYKTVGRQDNWGLYGREIQKLDPYTAPYHRIEEAFGKLMRTENGFVLNQEAYTAIKKPRG